MMRKPERRLMRVHDKHIDDVSCTYTYIHTYIHTYLHTFVHAYMTLYIVTDYYTEMGGAHFDSK